MSLKMEDTVKTEPIRNGHLHGMWKNRPQKITC